MQARTQGRTAKDEPLTFSCERCGAKRRTHMLEVSEGEVVSFARLCDACLKLEYARHLGKGSRP